MRTAFLTLAVSMMFFSMARAERISDFESPEDKEQRQRAIEYYNRTTNNEDFAILVNKYFDPQNVSPDEVAKFLLKTHSIYLRQNLKTLREEIEKRHVVQDGRLYALTTSKIVALEDSFHGMIKTIKDDRTSFSHYYYLGSLRKGATEFISDPVKQLVSADDVLTYLSTASLRMILGILPNGITYGSEISPSYGQYDGTQMIFVPRSHGN